MIHYRILPVLIVALMTSVVGAQTVSKSVTIYELSGAAQNSRPFTVSRVFAIGDIPNFAQAKIGGSGVVTQCDVKSRWPDGSVKHALVSFVASLSANGSLVVDFQDQAGGNNAGYVSTTAGMLAPSWMSGSPSWNAQMDLTGGSTLSVNARTMLSNLTIGAGKIRYWMQGPIVTQVIVEDRTSSMSQDVGFDSRKSLHPIYVLTFYNNWQGVKVEYIVENIWTTKMQDQTYSVSLKAGPGLTQVYSKGSFTHFGKTRWHKKYWSGADLDKTTSGNAKIRIDYNRSYMTHSMAIPTYDPAMIPGSSGISAAYASFTATDQGDINGNGQFLKNFNTTGGRPEIGLFPTWVGQYLATFDANLYKVVMGNADVSGHVPIHSRESNTAVPSAYFGRVGNGEANPTFWGFGCVGTCGNNGWQPDMAHQASFAYIPYLITGDWYYLEEMYSWAAWVGMANDPATCSYCRNGAMQVITQPNMARGLAWGLRNIAHAAWSAPDTDAADRVYFTNLLNNSLGAYEGKLNITNGSFYNTPQWLYGKNTIAPDGDGNNNGRLPNPLGFIMYDSLYIGQINADYGMDTSKVNYGGQQWMANYLRVCLGHIAELGFGATKLLEAAAKEIINSTVNPVVQNPYLQGGYIAPRTRKSDGLWFQDWASYYDVYTPAQKAKIGWSVVAPSSNDADCDNGYPHLARGAASFITNISDGPFTGQATYNWLDANVSKGCLYGNPKWAFIPRGGTSQGPPTSCDLNGDSQVNSVDIQGSINQALGAAPCSADLDQNGRCDVIDVQRVINASTGSTCRLGP